MTVEDALDTIERIVNKELNDAYPTLLHLYFWQILQGNIRSFKDIITPGSARKKVAKRLNGRITATAFIATGIRYTNR